MRYQNEDSIRLEVRRRLKAHLNEGFFADLFSDFFATLTDAYTSGFSSVNTSKIYRQSGLNPKRNMYDRIRAMHGVVNNVSWGVEIAAVELKGAVDLNALGYFKELPDMNDKQSIENFKFHVTSFFEQIAKAAGTLSKYLGEVEHSPKVKDFGSYLKPSNGISEIVKGLDKVIEKIKEIDLPSEWSSIKRERDVIAWVDHKKTNKLTDELWYVEQINERIKILDKELILLKESLKEIQSVASELNVVMQKLENIRPPDLKDPTESLTSGKRSANKALLISELSLRNIIQKVLRSKIL